MRHKLSIENIVDRVESLITRTDYYIKSQDSKQARTSLTTITELIENIRTLLNSEEQD